MLIIKNVRLWDGTGSPVQEGMAVAIEEGSIARVGRTSEIGSSEGAEVVDGHGMTLMPGLIDCHDHLNSFGYGLADKWALNEPTSTRHMRVAATLKQTLESGYTTVRDAGGLDAGFRMAVEQGIVPGPRLQVVLLPITPPGGLGEHRSPSGHHPPGPPDPSLPDGVANGPDGMRGKVREMVRAGADAIKTATTGGASSRPDFGPSDHLMSREEMDALVNEAHEHGRRVMCHALGGPGLRMAIEAGVDSIEHGTNLDEDPDLAKMMADKDIFYIPTFSVYNYHRERGTPHGRERSAKLREHHISSLELADREGVKIVAGTDAGGWVHGNNAEEIKCLVESGLSPESALKGATSRAAECLGLDSDVGTVSAGKTADLILVDRDPLADVSSLEWGKSVRLVLQGGRIVADRMGKGEQK